MVRGTPSPIVVRKAWSWGEEAQGQGREGAQPVPPPGHRNLTVGLPVSEGGGCKGVRFPLLGDLLGVPLQVAGFPVCSQPQMSAARGGKS